uniref:Uncharacterized protein n=1 Tax=Methylophaga nitratireducenticrescens TaxID=754476 RepID=I1XF78_METNJ
MNFRLLLVDTLVRSNAKSRETLVDMRKPHRDEFNLNHRTEQKGQLCRW